MQNSTTIFTPQEERMINNELLLSDNDEKRLKRARISRLLKNFRTQPPRVSIERARLFTESFKQTESFPLVLRKAKAMQKILNELTIYIEEDELIVGTCGGPGRHGILFPELRGGWLKESLENLQETDENPFLISDEDIKILKEEILPYWNGKTTHESYISMLPEETRYLVFGNDNYSTLGLIQDNANINATLNWAVDYQKVLQKGFNGIKKDAEERLNSLDTLDADNNFDKAFFLKAVIIVCDAINSFAQRYAKLAKEMAKDEKDEKDEKRRIELEKISVICERVPAHPARNFHEAVQAQWFTQLALRLEQPNAGVIGNGRIDQYLYPSYIRDIEEGVITEDMALEILECLWVKMAQFVAINATRAKSFWQGYAHFEQAVIGGQTEEGRDATNQLSYLILKSKKEFPINYPDLSVRIHSQTPEPFLWEVGQLIREGAGFPKLLNDEAIIPMLLSQGASLREARDYAGCGCTEVRMLNKDTYLALGASINLPAALEMALNDGLVTLKSEKQQLGPRTGLLRDFSSFNQVMDSFKMQVEFLIRHFYIRQKHVRNG